MEGLDALLDWYWLFRTSWFVFVLRMEGVRTVWFTFLGFIGLSGDFWMWETSVVPYATDLKRKRFYEEKAIKFKPFAPPVSWSVDSVSKSVRFNMSFTPHSIDSPIYRYKVCKIYLRFRDRWKSPDCLSVYSAAGVIIELLLHPSITLKQRETSSSMCSLVNPSPTPRLRSCHLPFLHWSKCFALFYAAQ